LQHLDNGATKCLMDETYSYPAKPAIKSRLEQAEARAVKAEARTELAKTRIEAAETRAEQAETRTEAAKTRTEQAEIRAEEAETHVEQAKILVGTLVETLAENLVVGQAVPVPPATSPADEADLQSLGRLTGRQREVLQLITKGENTKQIAGTLNISPKTVEYHRAKLMSVLDVHDIPGLVRFALRVGLISPEG
jgi:DNA-binding CsgD family transcriptional regulator